MNPVYIPPHAIKGRGSASTLAHRFAVDQREACDDGWGGLDAMAVQPTERPPTTVIDELARSAISHNESPDVPFSQSINPYRGGEHVVWRLSSTRKLARQ